MSNKFDLDSLDLTGGQRTALKTLLDEYADIFSSGPADLGRTGVVKHQIDTGDSPPIKQAPRRVPLHQQEVVRQHVEDMLQNGLVRPSTVPWASNIVLVKKNDGGTRFCVDYCELNHVTKKDAYPLPRIDETLDALAGAKLFSTWRTWPAGIGRSRWRMLTVRRQHLRPDFFEGRGGCTQARPVMASLNSR